MSGLGSICLVAALAASVAGPAAPPEWASLSDQHGRAMTAPAGPSIVVVVAARRARELRGWEERLRRLQPRPEVLRVVDVPEGGRVEEVARTLRKRAPAGVSIGVDAKRVVARALDLDLREPHVLVLDARGQVAGRVRGRADDRTAAAVGAVWDAAAGGR
jgi:hypothetical protein